ncbi:B12-binding domain-containing protein [Elusimicrobiota bacterium]
MELYAEIAKAMEEGEEEQVVDLVNKCLGEKKAASEIIEKGLIAAMDKIGVKFRNGDMFFPEVMLSASCMHAGMNILKPHLGAGEAQSAGKYLIGTVADDVHDVGKNLVAMNLSAAGFEVIDLGIEVPPEKFVEAIKEHDPDILGVSALLTTTMPHMKATIDAVDAAGLRKNKKLKIGVGGAPVDQEYADEIGADFYGNDAMEAVTIAKHVMAEQKGSNGRS